MDPTSHPIFYACGATLKTDSYTIIGSYGTGPTIDMTSKTVKQILKKLSKTPQQTLRSSYEQGALHYHVVQENQKAFVCVSGKKLPLRISFGFLGFD